MSDASAPAIPRPVKARPSESEAARPSGAMAFAPTVPVSGDPTWLIGDQMSRERMLDMDRLVAPVRQKSFIVIAAALLISGPWLGWWTIAPLVVAGIFFRVAEGSAERLRRPEYLLFCAWAASELMIAMAVAL